MLSNGFDAPLQLMLRASVNLFVIKIVLHVFALAALFVPSSIPIVLWGALFFVLLLNLAYVIFHFNRERRNPVTLAWNKFSDWKLYHAAEPEPAIYQQSIVLNKTPWFIVLRLTGNQHKKTLLITRDQSDSSDDWRRLNVLLDFNEQINASKAGYSEKAKQLLDKLTGRG